MANKRKKGKLNPNEVWTEEQLEDYLRFESIVGFTEGGIPFGIKKNWEDCMLYDKIIHKCELDFS
ncbi:MAG TPA: hypothetical protein VM577_04865 [Anaerovoracaceae bacterium]|nr:hypothetical protein [Anaerovoracaceae bacterium]